MSITINDQTAADRIALPFLDLVRAAWRRWRARLCTARRFLPATLILLATAACGASATAGPCPGSVSVIWFITTPDGQLSSCAQAGATSVALRLQSRTGGTPVFTAFPCARTPGTANIAPGLYDIAIELHDANGRRLAIAPQQTSVAVELGRTKVLAPVTFAVGAGGGGGGEGNISLALRAEGFASNCQPASGGAGITATTLTLERVNGGCAPVTFLRKRGNAEIGTYRINCSSPQIATCIEQDETLTAPELEPGAYVMHARGKIGATDCWAADPTLTVPAAGQLQAQIVLRHQPIAGC